MKLQDLVTIFITLVVGMIVGAYLYLFGFTQQFSFFGSLTENTSSLAITGSAYGGCEQGGICATYRIDEDGTYQAYPTVANRVAVRERLSGKLSDAQVRALKQTFTQASLEEYARPIAPETCSSDTGGIDYEFRIAVEGSLYVVNTCDTAVVRDAAALRLLRQVLSDVGL